MFLMRFIVMPKRSVSRFAGKRRILPLHREFTIE